MCRYTVRVDTALECSYEPESLVSCLTIDGSTVVSLLTSNLQNT